MLYGQERFAQLEEVYDHWQVMFVMRHKTRCSSIENTTQCCNARSTAANNARTMPGEAEILPTYLPTVQGTVGSPSVDNSSPSPSMLSPHLKHKRKRPTKPSDKLEHAAH